MKNSTDTIGNRTHNLLTCSAVSQPTAPPRAPRHLPYTSHICTTARTNFCCVNLSYCPSDDNSLIIQTDPVFKNAVFCSKHLDYGKGVHACAHARTQYCKGFQQIIFRNMRDIRMCICMHKIRKPFECDHTF
jgi:hypothetical protein